MDILLPVFSLSMYLGLLSVVSMIVDSYKLFSYVKMKFKCIYLMYAFTYVKMKFKCIYLMYAYV